MEAPKSEWATVTIMEPAANTMKEPSANTMAVVPAMIPAIDLSHRLSPYMGRVVPVVHRAVVAVNREVFTALQVSPTIPASANSLLDYQFFPDSNINRCQIPEAARGHLLQRMAGYKQWVHKSHR